MSNEKIDFATPKEALELLADVAYSVWSRSLPDSLRGLGALRTTFSELPESGIGKRVKAAKLPLLWYRHRSIIDELLRRPLTGDEKLRIELIAQFFESMGATYFEIADLCFDSSLEKLMAYVSHDRRLAGLIDLLSSLHESPGSFAATLGELFEKLEHYRDLVSDFEFGEALDFESKVSGLDLLVLKRHYSAKVPLSESARKEHEAYVFEKLQWTKEILDAIEQKLNEFWVLLLLENNVERMNDS